MERWEYFNFILDHCSDHYYTRMRTERHSQEASLCAQLGTVFHRKFPKVDPSNTSQKCSLTASLTTLPETENEEGLFVVLPISKCAVGL